MICAYGKWTRWEPVPGLACDYDVDALVDTGEKLEIILSESLDHDKKVRVIFEGAVYAYRSAEETFALGTLDHLLDRYGRAFCSWTFFKVTYSSFFQCLSRGVEQPRIGGALEQFSFFAVDGLIDVISDLEPQIECFVVGEKP